MDYVSLIIGIIIGLAFAIFHFKSKKTGSVLTQDKIDKSYVSKTFYNTLKEEKKESDDKIYKQNAVLGKLNQENSTLKETIEERKKEIIDLQEKMKLEFNNLSNKIFEEKSTKFLELNEQKVKNILDPLKSKLVEFEEKIERSHKKDIQDRASLETELKKMTEFNMKISDEANKLTNALKGDKKMQGDWGEEQLEQILNYSGLEEHIHYRKQLELKDEAGNKFRPDYIINLPDNKHIVIDSKVSLVAYENYFNAESDSDKESFLKEHVRNLQNHIKGLSEKNYQQLHSIKTVDYVLLFMPIEYALYIALKTNSKLFEYALNRNIILVSTSTILLALRTVSFVWKQENQKNNVLEIAKQSGKLYDKFEGFLGDLKTVGESLDRSKSTYASAMNKLVDSSKKGDTIIGRMEKIKSLGANATKQIPDSYLNRIKEN